jgi:hypothetical protein
LAESNYSFGNVDVIREPLIYANDKDEVKEILLNKYPQFFQKGKIYERETKDTAQFFYVVIFPLYNFEEEWIREGEWSCAQCGQIHENKYISKPQMNDRLFGGDVLFCRTDESDCMKLYKIGQFKNVEFPDDVNYITVDSLNYIYKITEKSTGKSYVGKTKNAPFFRWWNHLKHSSSPFGLYIRNSKLSDWTFEVLEELPSEIQDSEVFRIESDYIKKYDSINNGFNAVISKANVLNSHHLTP